VIPAVSTSTAARRSASRCRVPCRLANSGRSRCTTAKLVLFSKPTRSSLASTPPCLTCRRTPMDQPPWGSVHRQARPGDGQSRIWSTRSAGNHGGQAVFRKLRTGLPYVPRVIITDKLASDQVAHRAAALRGAQRAETPSESRCLASVRLDLTIAVGPHHLRTPDDFLLIRCPGSTCARGIGSDDQARQGAQPGRCAISRQHRSANTLPAWSMSVLTGVLTLITFGPITPLCPQLRSDATPSG